MSHPRDRRISLSREDHRYLVDDNQEYTSVTEYLSRFYKKFDKNRVLRENFKRWQKTKDSKYHGLSKEEILWEWDNAREEGTQMHERISTYLETGKGLEDREEDRQFLRFHERISSQWELVRSEWPIFDEPSRIAGCLDVLFREKEGKREFFICDWKRTEKVDKESKRRMTVPLEKLSDCDFIRYALQLNTYRWILQENYGIPVSGLGLVLFHPERPGYKYIQVPLMDTEMRLLFSWRRTQLKKEIGVKRKRLEQDERKKEKKLRDA